MNLFSPWNLLWMLPLLGGIVALWMLRLKRQEVTVSSLFLWRALLKETQANTPFQKLRRQLLLFLQLLAMFLLLFALARPFVWGRGLAGRTWVIVLDVSASMNATDASPTRLAAAKDAARQIVDKEMGGGDVATIIAAGNKPDTRLGFTTDRGRLKSAIDDTPATDTVADMPGALTLAQSLVAGRPGGQIRVITDGAYSRDDSKRLDALTFAGVDVRQVTVGTSAPDNVAITAMDGRRNPVTGNYQVFVSAQNLGSRPHASGTLSLYKDNRLVDARALDLSQGEQSETFDAPALKSGGLITAKLEDVKDDLATDNVASLALPPPRQRKVLLVSEGNIFLENGLNLNPDVTLAECRLGEFATLGHGGIGYAMVVFDGALPAPPLAPGNYLFFDAANGQTPIVTQAGTTDAPNLVDQNRTHPVMRFVDLEGLHFRQIPNAGTANWGEPLAEADSGTLIAVGEHNGIRAISLAFDLNDSDWPLRVSFPIFLTNAVNWLTAGSGLGASSPDTPTGGVASLTVPPGLSNLAITRPGGGAAVVSTPPNGGIVLYDGTSQVGIYHAHAAGYDYPFAVNLLNRDESTLTTQVHAALNHPASAPAAVTQTRRIRTDFWPTLAFTALLFLVLEWLAFHRRL